MANWVNKLKKRLISNDFSPFSAPSRFLSLSLSPKTIHINYDQQEIFVPFHCIHRSFTQCAGTGTQQQRNLLQERQREKRCRAEDGTLQYHLTPHQHRLRRALRSLQADRQASRRLPARLVFERHQLHMERQGRQLKRGRRMEPRAHRAAELVWQRTAQERRGAGGAHRLLGERYALQPSAG